MLQKRLITKIFPIFLLGIVLCGCSKSSNTNLTRDKAKKILAEYINKDPKIKTELPTGFVVTSQMPSAADFGLDLGGVSKQEIRDQDYVQLSGKSCVILQDLGLVMLGRRYYVTVPENMKKYVLNTKKGEALEFNGQWYTKDETTVLLGEFKMGEILGITEPSVEEGRKVCYADFNVNMNKTPFGEVLLSKKFQKSPIDFTAQFILYDDGWRLIKVSLKGGDN